MKSIDNAKEKSMKKDLLMVIVVIGILLTVASSGCILKPKISDGLLGGEDIVRYYVDIDPNQSGEYFAYFPILYGNSEMDMIMLQRLNVVYGSASFSRVETEYGPALKVISTGKTRLEINWNTSSESGYHRYYPYTHGANISLINETSHSVLSVEKVHYKIYFVSSANATAIVHFGFHMEWFGQVVGKYREGYLSQDQISTGWNYLNGTYYFYNST